MLSYAQCAYVAAVMCVQKGSKDRQGCVYESSSPRILSSYVTVYAQRNCGNKSY